MKTLIITLFIYLLTYSKVFALPGEYWFLFDDDYITNYNYIVVATRISMNEPLFGRVNGIDFMEVNSTLYNEVTSDEDILTGNIPAPFDVRRGFDFLRDPSGWPEIGEGKLEFSIYVVYETGGSDRLFSFRLDNLHADTSPDLTFEFRIGQPGVLIAKGGNPQVVTYIYSGDYVQSWNLLGEQRNISPYFNDVELTNDVNGIAENDIKITFNTAAMGFPDGTAQIGPQYDPGAVVHLWRGVYYDISTSHQSYIINIIIYNFRNWYLYQNYFTTSTLKVEDYTDKFRADFFPTIPLTVANNLEGGSSNNDYEITWQTPPIAQTWQYGTSFNAFPYSLFLDLYSATASDQFQALGTTWWFHHWEDGSYNPVKSNIQVTTPTTITAYYKGNLCSNDQNGVSNPSQRKMVRTDNGQYHVVYESMGTVFYTYSLTTNFQGAWSPEEPLHTHGKNPSIAYYGNTVKIVFEYYDPQQGGNAKIYLATYEAGMQVDWEEVTSYPNSYYGNAKPVVAFTDYEKFIAYRSGTTGGIKYTTNWYDTNRQRWTGWDDPEDIPGTGGYSQNPSVVSFIYQANYIGIAYEDFGNIYFRQANRVGLNWNWGSSYYYPVPLSRGCGFNLNRYPVISVSNNSNRYLMVSWQGIYDANQTSPLPKTDGSDPLYREAAVVKTGYGTSWGTPSNFSKNVDYTTNGSLNALYGSIVTWSESDGKYSKYVRRRTDTGYDPITSFQAEHGIYTLVSNGSEFGNIKAMVFNNSGDAPYFLNRCTDDFTYIPDGMGKLNDAGIVDISYGRSGVVEKNGLEFVFNIGDVLLNGETIKFIERVDTLPISSIEELNASVISDTLNLNPQSELIFSDYYYVVNAESADSLLSNEFNVNFKCELVKLSTGEVVGVFEDMNYNKNNTEKYGNEGYLVDCSGIESGEYYLRLTTTVNEEVGPSLSDIQMDNVQLEKSNLNIRNFKGENIPIEYALEQNYPNPFNPATTIRYQIPKDGIVTLKVYDILGAEVATLVNEQKVKGNYEVNFDASRLASGIYIYRLNVNDPSTSSGQSFVNVKKMVLLK